MAGQRRACRVEKYYVTLDWSEEKKEFYWWESSRVARDTQAPTPQPPLAYERITLEKEGGCCMNMHVCMGGGSVL